MDNGELDQGVRDLKGRILKGEEEENLGKGGGKIVGRVWLPINGKLSTKRNEVPYKSFQGHEDLSRV